MVAAAKAGKHIFTEKAMAPTLAECKTISAAVAQSGVKFCISHPHLTTGIAQYAKKAIEDGLLGAHSLHAHAYGPWRIPAGMVARVLV